MKCHEARRELDLFMDGELSVPDNMKILEHLNLCRSCSGIYEGEKALRGALKTELGNERVPDSLLLALGRISRGEESRHAMELPSRRWGMVAAALFLGTLMGVILFTPSSVETPSAFAAVAVSTHEDVRTGFHGRPGPNRICLCGECCRKSDQPVNQFFRKHVGYDVCTHELKAIGYGLASAAVSEHRGGTVCWTILQDGRGHSITHALVATPLGLGGKVAVLDSCRRPVVLVPVPGRPGFTCVFILDDDVECDRFCRLLGVK
jgi:hypothetical protein